MSMEEFAACLLKVVLSDFNVRDIPDNATHFVLVHLTPSAKEDLQFLRKKMNVKKIYTMPSGEDVVLEFHDIRQAVFAYTILATNKVQYVDYKFLHLDDTSHATLLLSGFPAHLTEAETRRILGQFGDVWYFHRLDRPNIPPVLQSTLWIEYYDFRDALYAKSHLDELIFHGRLLFCDFVPDVNGIDPLLTKFYRQFSSSKEQQLVIDSPSFAPASLISSASSSSCSSTNVIQTWDKVIKRPPGFENFQQYQQNQNQIQNQQQYLQDQKQKERVTEVESDNEFYKTFKFDSNRVVDLSLPAGNRVYIENIMAGNDKRTTFMIRNIPNKYTQQMLINLVNESHKGKYDFLYLRMDFKNKCNVGYAFINFPDPKDAVSFALRICGKKWTRFNSEKICSMSYANIQGRDALINKFRDSQVMFESETYRPKLFHTKGPNMGEEELFPEPLRPAPTSTKRPIASFDKQHEMKVDIKKMTELKCVASAESSHLYSPSVSAFNEQSPNIIDENHQNQNQIVDELEQLLQQEDEKSWTPWTASLIPFRPSTSTSSSQNNNSNSNNQH